MFVWIVETALCLAASYTVALAVYPERGLAHRLVAVHLVALSLILVALEVCGLARVLTPVVLGLASTVIFGVAGALALRSVGRAHLTATLRADLGAPWRTLREVWTEREPAIGALVPAGVALGVVLTMVWFYKSWTWDPVWYHVPITAYVIQLKSLHWIDSHIPWVQGYPRNVELISVWNCIFPMDNRFDDTGQLPFAALGSCVVTAWSRRVGASRPLSLALGAAWFALPPVFLQAHSTHVDVAAGALFSTSVYFMATRPEARDRWMCALALGLYVGTKFSGVFHLALLTPWALARVAHELWHLDGLRARLRRLGDVALSLVAFGSVGPWKYLDNIVHKGNPMYPFRTKVPVLGELPGPEDVGALYGIPAGVRPSFFGVPGDFDHLLQSWFDPHPFFAPDVRGGGFGPAFRWLLMPCVLIVVADLVRLKDWRRAAPVVALFAGALVVPAAWWPRYTIGAATASLVAFAMVQPQLPLALGRALLSCALVGLLWTGYDAGRAGFIAYPRHFAKARNASWEERAGLQLDAFLWPEPWGLTRERELKAGDVITYDEWAIFVGEFFSRDYRTRVTFVPSSGDPAAYVARLRALNARWVGVHRGSPAEVALIQAGAEFLFAAPVSEEVVYRMPRAR